MRVLLIDSGETADPAVFKVLTDFGYEVASARPNSHDEHAVATKAYDLIVVDLDQFAHHRVATIARLRSNAPSVPLLMLSWGADANERVAGLDAGADDCIARPFDPIELRARVRALLRRRHRDTMRLGRLEWDWEHRQGEIDATPVMLSRYETVLLESLLRSPNRVVSMNVLAHRIETAGGREANNRLYVYISRLRKKLHASGLKIRSSSGLGYWIEFQHEPPAVDATQSASRHEIS